MKMIVDDILEYLCSKMAIAEWIRSFELTEIIQKFGLSREESREMVDFLEKYFLEADESKQKVRMLDWSYNLFESSIS